MATWIWDVNNGNKNYTGGNWPGKVITVDPTSGYHKYTFSVTDSNPKLKVIFNNNNNGTQTADLDLYNNGIYTASGFTGEYYGATNVIETVDYSDVKVSVRNGSLVIETPEAMTVVIVRADGTITNATVQAGYTSIELPKGVYIVAGKKVII